METKKEFKKCPCCGENKPLTQFYKAKNRKDGHQVYCKVCINKKHKKNVEKNKEKNKSGGHNISKEKKCPSCGRILLISEFYCDNSASDGHYTYCKKCVNDKQHCDYMNNKQKYNEKQKKWRKNNPEKVNKQKERYKQRHPDADRLRAAKYRENNREKYLQAKHRYYNNHREQIIIDANKRREKINNISDGSITPDFLKELYWGQNRRCNYCGCKLTYKNRNLDHILPISRGGMNTSDNVHWVCVGCNSSKHNKTEEEWFQWLKNNPSERSDNVLAYIRGRSNV